MKSLEEKLDDKIVEEIKKAIARKQESDNLNKIFVNPILRMDILDLLDRYCTVVYFPLKGDNQEENNGFLLKNEYRSDALKYIVFINTNQTYPKQAFTAAHELGHIWDIYGELIKNGITFAEDDINLNIDEKIANRFASELLMPKDYFLPYVSQISNELMQESKEKTEYVIHLIKVIVHCMNEFCTPYKATVIRFYELSIISKTSAEALLGFNVSKEVGEVAKSIADFYIKNYKFDKLNEKSEKTHIDNLPELLLKAEEKGLVLKNKVNYLRKIFEVPKADNDIEILSEIITDNKDGLLDE